MYVKTGSYTGDGNAGGQSITGVGFQPRIVLVRRDNATNGTIVRIEGMTANNSKPITGANATNTNGIKSLDADGFTTNDANANVNQAATVYQYLAIGGAGSDFAYGTYAGDTTDNRDITVGFAPDFVLVVPESAVRCPWRSSDFSGDDSMNFTQAHTTNLIQGFGASTFQVGTGMNAGSTAYAWIAIKATAGVFKTFTYTGTGVDDRDITTPGFQPTFALTQRNDAAAAIVRNAAVHSGDESIPIDASAADAANKIQAFISTGMTIGTDTSVNANTVVYYGFAFKDAPASGGSSASFIAINDYQLPQRRQHVRDRGFLFSNLLNQSSNPTPPVLAAGRVKRQSADGGTNTPPMSGGMVG